MLTVDIDRNSGFCAGVIRAISRAEEFLKENNTRLYSLGAIVHNDSELERLSGKGLVTIDKEDFDEMVSAEGEVLLIRAHGEPPQTYERAASLGFQVIDCTCPVVLKLQQHIKESYLKQKETGLGQILGGGGHIQIPPRPLDRVKAFRYRLFDVGEFPGVVAFLHLFHHSPCNSCPAGQAQAKHDGGYSHSHNQAHKLPQRRLSPASVAAGTTAGAASSTATAGAAAACPQNHTGHGIGDFGGKRRQIQAGEECHYGQQYTYPFSQNSHRLTVQISVVFILP